MRFSVLCLSLLSLSGCTAHQTPHQDENGGGHQVYFIPYIAIIGVSAVYYHCTREYEYTPPTPFPECIDYKKSFNFWGETRNCITFSVPTEWRLDEVVYHMDSSKSVSKHVQTKDYPYSYTTIINGQSMGFECVRIHRGKLIVNLLISEYMYKDHTDVYAAYQDFREWIALQIQD